MTNPATLGMERRDGALQVFSVYLRNLLSLDSWGWRRSELSIRPNNSSFDYNTHTYTFSTRADQMFQLLIDWVFPFLKGERFSRFLVWV